MRGTTPPFILDLIQALHMKWLNPASRTRATVEAIYLAETAGAPMRLVPEAEALTGAGLKGDRYATRTGYWAGPDGCQVTLIAGEDLDDIAQATGLKLKNGEHRRNIVTRGLALAKLEGKDVSCRRGGVRIPRPAPAVQLSGSAHPARHRPGARARRRNLRARGQAGNYPRTGRHRSALTRCLR